MLNLLVVGWETAQISTPALLSNKAATEQGTCDFGCISWLKTISSLEVDLANLPKISLQMHAEAYEGGH